MLPGISGLDLCRQLKGAEETTLIPIIMVTASIQHTNAAITDPNPANNRVVQKTCDPMVE